MTNDHRKHYGFTGGWDVHTQRIYDETYNKVYRAEMNRFRDQSPRPWYEAEAEALATNIAEDALDNYLDTPDK